MRVLMCPPLHFDVPVEDKNLNPWMSKQKRPQKPLAWEQWKQLLDLYNRLGLRVETLAPRSGLFDQVFTANIAWHKGRTAVIARLAPEWRREEERIVRKWFVRNGYRTISLPNHFRFEGQGDILSIGPAGYLFCYGIRNSFEVKAFLEKTFRLKRRITPLRLVSPEFYHGDVCIRYSAHRRALLYNPSAFDSDSLRLIENLPVKKMEAPRELWVQETNRGRNFPLNGCYIGRVETFPWNEDVAPFPKKVRSWIEKDGGKVWLHRFDQFGLSGAGHRCCSYFLD